METKKYIEIYKKHCEMLNFSAQKRKNNFLKLKSQSSLVKSTIDGKTSITCPT